jgi:hypothetical protein
MLFTLDGEVVRRAAEGLGSEILSIAVDGSRIAVATREGAFVSIDAGEHFRASEGGGAVELAREHGKHRLWARAAKGGLFRSVDFGASYEGPLLLRPVLALAAPPDGGIAALCAGHAAPAQIASSDDGGKTFAAVDGPSLVADPGELSLAIVRDFVAVSAERDPRGPWLSSDRGKTWSRIPGIAASCPVALAWEGGLALYAAHALPERSLIVRYRPGGGDAGLVLELSNARVHALHIASAGRFSVVHVASDAGLHRVLIDPEEP